ncbi:MAG: hypothetical protein A2172_03730 [Candidatus Woykebacteria bacterium RBG_13_40_15]|uniref:Uncharacterized protein n=1 Tax=Candidatus Woykebacteria bacterium RBG_13_40_15 TaxID=1802593 RepID=A0A1G1W6J3_9BACT|nr:MAG: hypothetical protein A2172_03730 [Candidatus Woykebacteria bacterium RBG_13_40_15]
MATAQIVESMVAFMRKFWWMFVIIGLIFVALYFYNKWKKNQIQYHDQIAENKRIWTEEMELNRTEIKKLVYKDRVFQVLGERWIGRSHIEIPKIGERVEREYKEFELKQLQFESIRNKIKGMKTPEIVAHKFLVRTKYLDLKIFSLYFGEKNIIYLDMDDFSLSKKRADTAIINDSLRLMYEKGVYIPMRVGMVDIVSEETERVMKDLEINARGNQQKDFSRIRSDFAHSEVMKEKDIEQEKEKKKATSYG